MINKYMKVLATLFIISLMFLSVEARSLKRLPTVGRCNVCTYVASLLENFLDSNTTEAHLEKIADKGCNLLPETIRPSCPEIIDFYLPQIISLLETKNHPDVLCSKLKLCSEWSFREEFIGDLSAISLKTKSKNSSIECVLCEASLSMVENRTLTYLDSPKWKHLFYNCRILPADRVDVCQDIVTFLPVIFSTFVKDHTVRQLCENIHAC